MSAGILKYLDISQSEYEQIRRIYDKRVNEETNLQQENENNDELKEKQGNEDDKKDNPISDQPVLSSRNKTIEEVPSVQQNKTKSTPKFQPKTRTKPKPKSKENKKDNCEEPDVTEYIKQKEILYPKLIKDIVNQFDKEMLIEAKKANSIGGKQQYIKMVHSENLDNH